MKWKYVITYVYCGITNEKTPRDKKDSGTVIASTKQEAKKKAGSNIKISGSSPWKFDKIMVTEIKSK